MILKKRAMVFDAIAWTNNGGDAEDNSVFMKPATVVSEPYHQEGYTSTMFTLLVDVIFDHKPNYVSKGHFEHCVEYI